MKSAKRRTGGSPVKQSLETAKFMEAQESSVTM